MGVVVSFLVSFFLVLTKRWHGILSFDESSGVQKVHAQPTPRVGGFAIVLGLVMALGTAPAEFRNKLFPLLVAGSLAFGFGFIEDLTKRVTVLARLLATMGSGLVAWFITGYSLSEVNVWGVDALLQSKVISVLFTAFAIGGLANAINIIDGLHGLASSMVIWAFLGVGTLAAGLGDSVLAATCFFIAASVFGFFLVNWPFGKLFLGDGGSYFLGFSLAWVCVMLVERHSQVSAFAALLICIHPITEVLFSVYRRKVRHKPSGQPDRLHLHSLVKRRLLRRYFPAYTTTFRNSVAGVSLGCLSLLPVLVAQWTFESTSWSLFFVVAFVLAYLSFYKSTLVLFGRSAPRQPA